jgi:hypothetical protein
VALTPEFCKCQEHATHSMAAKLTSKFGGTYSPTFSNSIILTGLGQEFFATVIEELEDHDRRAEPFQ